MAKKNEIFNGETFKEAVRKLCWDEDRHVIINHEDGRAENATIGISRRDHHTVTKKGTGGLDLFSYKIKSIQLLN